MFRRALPLLTACLIIAAVSVAAADDARTFVRLSTNHGDILLEMYPEQAPNHVANFLHLGTSGFYTGTRFHRVIPGFMIQGGDPNSRDDNKADDGQGGPTLADVLPADLAARFTELQGEIEARGYAPPSDAANLKAEFNDESHERGVVSMARSRHPDSAGSQFFICVAPSTGLDGQYSVFGRAVAGLDTADAIAATPRDRNDNPDEPVTITGFTVLEGEGALTDDERAALVPEETEATAAAVE